MQERKTGIIVNFLIRAIVGVVLIFFMNEFLESKGIIAGVGINWINFGVSGVLGVPGVVLLYGIALYSIW